MWDRWTRMIGEEQLKKLQQSSVLVIGIGGVGGYALEALVRCGIGKVTIVDDDQIELSNLNRQIIANHLNIGEKKVIVAAKRIQDIAPQCQVITICDRFTLESVGNFSFDSFDFIIDAIDDIPVKAELMKQLTNMKKSFIASMGTGNRYHPELLEITMLHKTSMDPLAKKIRTLLRKEHIDLKIPVVWSREQPIASKALGSCCMVPMAAGSLLASYAIQSILKKND